MNKDCQENVKHCCLWNGVNGVKEGNSGEPIMGSKQQLDNG